MKQTIGLDALATPRRPDFPLNLSSAVDFICDNFDQEIGLEEIAAAAGVSKFHLCRRFNRSFGLTVMGWVWALRAHLARELIIGCPHLRLTDIAFSCGFNSSAHFSRAFRKIFDTPPSDALRVYLGFGPRLASEGSDKNPHEVGVRIARALAYKVLLG